MNDHVVSRVFFFFFSVDKKTVSVSSSLGSRKVDLRIYEVAVVSIAGNSDSPIRGWGGERGGGEG